MNENKETNDTRISNTKMIFFIALSNILIISEVGFYTFFTPFDHSAWIALLIYIFITFFISIIFKGFPNNSGIIKKINKNKIIKLLILFYYIIIISTMIFLSTIIIKQKFYSDINIIIIYGTLLLCCIYVGNHNFNNIINVALIFFVLILIFYFISFTHLDGRNFKLLLPLTIDIKKLYRSRLILIFPLENILFSLNSDNLKKGFNRKIFTIGNILSMFYLLIIFIDSISLLGANYFKDVKFGSFIRWQVYQGNKFIENFDIFVLVIMVITITFRMAININNVFNILLCKKKNKFNLIFYIIIFIILTIYCLFINYLNIIMKYVLFCSFFISIIIYIYFIILSFKIKRGNKNV